MPERVILDEFHLTMTVPDNMPDSQIETIRRIFASRKFRAALKQVVTSVLRSYPDLRGVRLTVTV